MIIFTQVPANVFAADTYICNKYFGYSNHENDEGIFTVVADV